MRGALINKTTHQIRGKLVYYATGTSAAHEDLSHLHRTVGGTLSKLSAGGDDGALVMHLPLSLGEIRGFDVRFDLYTVPSDEAQIETCALILKGADGIIFIVQADPEGAKFNAIRLAALDSHLKGEGVARASLPIAYQVVGSGRAGALASAKLIDSLAVSGQPLIEADLATGAGVFDSVKAVAMQVLLNAWNE